MLRIAADGGYDEVELQFILRDERLRAMMVKGMIQA
jgi:hypothetical protein